MTCTSCGYRYTSVEPVSSFEPVQYRFSVTTPEDLNVRVIRSTHAQVSVPEMGITIDPGPGCEGFISTIEGVIHRIDAVLDTILLTADQQERERALVLKEQVSLALEGKFPVTIIIRDPSGISSIESDAANRSSYDPEEEIR